MKSVDIGEKLQAQLGQTIVLAYKATGRREDAKSYSALCSSTYVRDDGRWKLLSNQQTPIT